LIISIENEINDSIMINIEKAVTSIQEYSFNNYLIPISAAVGDYVDDIEDTSKSYKSAKDYIRYRFKNGLKSILWKNRVESKISRNNNYDEDLEESIFRELKAGNIDKVEKELDKMFNSIMKFNYNDMMLAISRLLDSSHKIIKTILQMSRSNAELNIENFSNGISTFQTAEETKVFILSLYINTINQLKDKKKNRKNEVIDNVVNYINENYSYVLLTPETIAGNLKLSPNYLRILFKDIEGKSLSNYINEVRFNKAKALLESTDLNVAEISVKVGFSNDNYFYTAFKKFYGISPNNYRNTVKVVPF
jgi:two-component system, response regulator YesN